MFHSPQGKQRQSRDMGDQLPSLQEKPRENDEEKKSLLVRLREMEQQVTQLRAQLEDKESENRNKVTDYRDSCGGWSNGWQTNTNDCKRRMTSL